MNIVLNTKTKLIATIIVIIMVSGLILREHFNGGVISHHFLHDKNMPGISNWWGLLSMPIMTWLSLSIIQRRKRKNHEEEKVVKSEIYGFIGGLLFGVALTILFYKESDLSNYLFFLTFVLALFIPIFKPEYYLGFILGMVFGFGGVLPVLIGLILFVIYAIEYNVIRKAFLYIIKRIRIQKE